MSRYRPAKSCLVQALPKGFRRTPAAVGLRRLADGRWQPRLPRCRRKAAVRPWRWIRPTAEVVWKSGDDEAGYASPVVATIGGKRPVVVFKAAHLVGLDAKDGHELWRTEWKTSYDVNAATPIVIGDRILITSWLQSRRGLDRDRGGQGQRSLEEQEACGRRSIRPSWSARRDLWHRWQRRQRESGLPRSGNRRSQVGGEDGERRAR